MRPGGVVGLLLVAFYLVLAGGATFDLADFSWTPSYFEERTRGSQNVNLPETLLSLAPARGSILAYLNSDDVYLPGAVAQAVAALEAHSEAAAVYGEGYHVDEEGRILERYPTEPFKSDRLQETCFICQPTVFLRRDVVERAGYLDESLRYCVDDLWIRLARAGKMPHATLSREHPTARRREDIGPARPSAR